MTEAEYYKKYLFIYEEVRSAFALCHIIKEIGRLGREDAKVYRSLLSNLP